VPYITPNSHSKKKDKNTYGEEKENKEGLGGACQLKSYLIEVSFDFSWYFDLVAIKHPIRTKIYWYLGNLVLHKDPNKTKYSSGRQKMNPTRKYNS
jgi:hypothetical protein